MISYEEATSRCWAEVNLDKLLHNELCPESKEAPSSSVSARIREILTGKKKEKDNGQK